MIKKIIYFIILFLIILCLHTDEYQLFLLISNDNEYVIDFSRLRKIYSNEDIVGRLEIPYLFNIFVVMADNNEYYLYHSIDRRKDIRGVPFIDYRDGFNGNQINIYGHNSYVFELPFKLLLNYLNKDFFNKNNVIILDIMNEIRVYEILMIKEVKDNEHMKYYDNESFLKHIDRLKDDAIYERNIRYDEDSQLLILQTCSLNESYYIIGAIRI